MSEGEPTDGAKRGVKEQAPPTFCVALWRREGVKGVDGNVCTFRNLEKKEEKSFKKDNCVEGLEKSVRLSVWRDVSMFGRV